MNAETARLLADDDAQAANAGARIFNAARELFYRQGIRAVSVEQIAEAAATTKMTLYRYFSSKDELVAAVLREQDRHFWEWWDSTIAPYEGDPRKQIECLFSGFEAAACDEDFCRGCPIVNAAVEIVEDDHPARRIVVEHHAELLRRLRKLAALTGARDPKALGDALALLMGGSFVARLVFQGARPTRSVSAAAKVLLDCSTLGVCAE